MPEGTRNKPDLFITAKKISYPELWDSSLRLSAALSQRGVRKGDRVAVYMQNCPHFVISFLGIMRANAVTVPLNPMLVAEEFRRLLEDCGARVVITTTDLYPRVAEVCQEMGISDVIVGSYHDYLPAEPEIPAGDFLTQVPARAQGGIPWTEALSEGAVPPPVEVGPEDLCLLPYTAGSTGIPRAVCIPMLPLPPMSGDPSTGLAAPLQR